MITIHCIQSNQQQQQLSLANIHRHGQTMKPFVDRVDELVPNIYNRDLDSRLPSNILQALMKVENDDDVVIPQGSSGVASKKLIDIVWRNVEENIKNKK